MMSHALAPLSLCVLLETGEHVSYRVAGRHPARHAAWTALGVGLHLALLAAWFWLLSLLPLGVALPLRGASYLSIAFAGTVLLQEQLHPRGWIGVVAIITGLALVGAG